MADSHYINTGVIGMKSIVVANCGVPSHGQIALQAHDPNSKVFYRNIRVKVLLD